MMPELFIVNDSDEVKVLQGPQVAPPEAPKPVRVKPPRPQAPAAPFVGEIERLLLGSFVETKTLAGPHKAEARKQDYTRDFRKLADKMKLSDADRSELLAAVSKWIGNG